jgi:hypothetical protein
VYKKKTEAAKKDYLKALAAYRASLVSKVRAKLHIEIFLLLSYSGPSMRYGFVLHAYHFNILYWVLDLLNFGIFCMVELLL